MTPLPGRPYRWATVVMLAPLLALLFPQWSRAHGVSVFAWIDGQTVQVESKFSGGRRPVEAPIAVYDLKGRKLLEGVTDRNGRFSFGIPSREGFKIVLHAGMGHQAEWIVPRSELTASLPDAAADPVSTPLNPPDPNRPRDSEAPVPAAGTRHVPAAAELEAVVDRVVRERLKPVIRQLADARHQGPDVRDIAGGIGYIVGLVGLAAYVNSRRKCRSGKQDATGHDQ
jgi:nickel transport protein